MELETFRNALPGGNSKRAYTAPLTSFANHQKHRNAQMDDPSLPRRTEQGFNGEVNKKGAETRELEFGRVD